MKSKTCFTEGISLLSTTLWLLFTMSYALFPSVSSQASTYKNKNLMNRKENCYKASICFQCTQETYLLQVDGTLVTVLQYESAIQLNDGPWDILYSSSRSRYSFWTTNDPVWTRSGQVHLHRPAPIWRAVVAYLLPSNWRQIISARVVSVNCWIETIGRTALAADRLKITPDHLLHHPMSPLHTDNNYSSQENHDLVVCTDQPIHVT